MGMYFSMGADFKERNLKEGAYLLIMFRHPFPGHKECGGNLLLNEIVDQCLIVASPFLHGAEIERQRDSRTRGRARLNHLGLREGRNRWDKQHHKDQAQYP